MKEIQIRPEVQMVLMDNTINFYKQKALLYMQHCFEMEKELKELKEKYEPVIVQSEVIDNGN